MDMCYDGALVMPGSFAVMCEDEMTYVEGGKTFIINRAKINKAAKKVWSTIGGVSTIAWLANKSAAQIGWKIAGVATKFARALASVGGFAGFALQAVSLAIAGVIVASAITLGIVYATNSTLKIRY